jgi:hypothetical protein
MPRPKTKVISGLTSKGFLESSGDHVMLVYYTRDGRKTRIRTKASHTPKMKDIPDNLLSQMAKQCKLTKEEFLGVVDCPIKRDTLEALLAERGEI